MGNSVSIGVSDPGHLPLTGAHVRGGYVNARSWMERIRKGEGEEIAYNLSAVIVLWMQTVVMWAGTWTTLNVVNYECSIVCTSQGKIRMDCNKWSEKAACVVFNGQLEFQFPLWRCESGPPFPPHQCQLLWPGKTGRHPDKQLRGQPHTRNTFPKTAPEGAEKHTAWLIFDTTRVLKLFRVKRPRKWS